MPAALPPKSARPPTRLTIGIQRRLTKPFRREPGGGTAFCRHGNRGCLPSCTIIKAMVDRCNPGTISCTISAAGPLTRRFHSHRARRPQAIATNFADVSPWRGKHLREENGEGSNPCRLCTSNKLVRCSRALVQRGSLGLDGFRRNIGKVRIQPRRCGSGRHRRCAGSTLSGRPIVRHPSKSAFMATGTAPSAGACGCRRETK